MNALPVTTWLTARFRTSTAKIALIATPATIAPAMPSAVLPLKYAMVSAAKAPDSIAPSIPILTTPLSSTSSSPNAASRMGVAMVMTETRNASSIGHLRNRRHRGRFVVGRAEDLFANSAPRGSVDREDAQNYEALDDRHQLRRDSLRALHRLRAVVERAEQERGGNDSERVQARDQSDGDRLEAPAGRELLVQSMRNGRDLHGAAESGERARQRHHPDRERGDADAEEGRGATIAAHRAQLESRAGIEHQQVARAGEQDREQHAEVEAAWREVKFELGGGCYRRAGRIGARRLHQRTVHDPAERLDGDEVEHDGADNFVDVAPRAEPSREAAPGGAAKCSCGEYDYDRNQIRKIAEMRPDRPSGDRADHELSVGADIPQRAREGERDGESSENERG